MLRPWSKNVVSTGNKAALAMLLGSLNFVLSKGSGAFLVNTAHIRECDLIKRGGNGSVSNYYRPDDDPGWNIPAIQAGMKSTLLVPGVLMAAEPRGQILPFAADWTGSAEVIDVLRDDSTRGVWFKFAKSASSDAIGGYRAKRLELDEHWDAIYRAVKWPNDEEIFASIPVVSFARMCAEDYSYRVLADDAAK